MTVTIDGTTGITTPGLTNTGAEAVTGNLTVNGNTTLGDASTDTILMTGAPSIGGAGYGMGMGFRNRIINGQMQIAQRATSATITAGSTIAAGYSTVDRFYVYCTGANVTAAQVAGSGAIKNNLQITGAASVTAVGIGQRIEQLNSYDLAGSTATLSVNISNSLLTTVTWTAYYANTANTFGTLASPTRTQISTGTFTVTSTLTNYSANISIPAAATTGIEVVFTVGAQTSGTWVVGNVQIEKGSTATSFDYRPYGTDLALCQRYYIKTFPQGTAPAQAAAAAGNLSVGGFSGQPATQCALNWTFPVVMRTTPTVTTYTPQISGSGGFRNSAGTETGATVDFIGDSRLTIYNTSSLGANFRLDIHAAATAEL